MLNRLVFFGLLALPGAFVVLTIVCLHPRYRKKAIQLAGVPDLLSRFERTSDRAS